MSNITLRIPTIPDPDVPVAKAVEVVECKQTKMQTFEIINWIAAGGHLFNAALTLVIGDDKQYQVYDTYASWTKYNGTCPPTQYKVEGSRGTFLVNPRDKAPTMSLSLLWLIFAFHILSAFFQGYAGCSRNYVYDITQRGVNPLRFIEYAASATIMLVCIALVSGIDEYFALLAVVTLTFVTMMLGLVAEILFDDLKTDYRLKQIGWVAHFTGWVTMLAAYGGVILKQYFFSIEKSDEGPPEWVTAVIFAVFGLYNIFGATQFVQLCCKFPLHKAFKEECVETGQKQVCGSTLNVFVEMLYVTNSLVTKSLLGWMIIANLVVEDNRDLC
jgi:hypothetical protein